MCGNSTAIFCINKMGTSHSMDCHYLTVRTIADRESRVCHVNSK